MTEPTGASVVLASAYDGCTKHPCSNCGMGFWFASKKPEPSWRCGYCTPTEYAAAMDERGANQREIEEHESGVA